MPSGLPSHDLLLAASAGHPSDVPPLMSVERQCQTNWCWAAVAFSVARYRERTTLTDQREFALGYLLHVNWPVTRGDCCDPPCHSPLAKRCDVPSDLVGPLDWVGVAAGPAKPNPIDETTVRAQLQAGLPVCARIAWPNGGPVGHFIAIVGVSTLADGRSQYSVCDPLYGDIAIPHQSLISAYKSGGRWATTYLTR